MRGFLGTSALSALPFFDTDRYRSDPPGCLRLHLSESTLGCSPDAQRAVAAQLNSLHQYPDPTGGRLVELLAAFHGVSTSQVVVGNGIDGLLLLSALALIQPSVGAIVTDNTYAGHAHAVDAVRAPRRNIPLRGYRIDVDRIVDSCAPGSLIYICNPHNPTGAALTSDEVGALAGIAETRQAILIMDEAYIEYADDDMTSSAIEYARQGLPVIVMRTFSKVYGLAGLRCGYTIAPTSLSAELRKLKNILVFNVNRLALAAAEASIEDESIIARVRSLTSATRNDIQARIEACEWLSAPASVTNFVLLHTPWFADTVRTELERRRILVRSGAALGFPRHVRLSIGTDMEMDQAFAALYDLREHLPNGPSWPIEQGDVARWG